MREFHSVHWRCTPKSGSFSARPGAISECLVYSRKMGPRPSVCAPLLSSEAVRARATPTRPRGGKVISCVPKHNISLENTGTGDQVCQRIRGLVKNVARLHGYWIYQNFLSQSQFWPVKRRRKVRDGEPAHRLWFAPTRERPFIASSSRKPDSTRAQTFVLPRI